MEIGRSSWVKENRGKIIVNISIEYLENNVFAKYGIQNAEVGWHGIGRDANQKIIRIVQLELEESEKKSARTEVILQEQVRAYFETHPPLT